MTSVGGLRAPKLTLFSARTSALPREIPETGYGCLRRAYKDEARRGTARLRAEVRELASELLKPRVALVGEAAADGLVVESDGVVALPA